MIHFLRSAWDGFRGAGASALSVPSMDGAFKPNQLLENAPLAAAWERPDNLAVAGGRVYFSSGGKVLVLTGPGTAELVGEAPEPVTAMAGLADGTLAVARSGKGVSALLDPHDRFAGKALSLGNSGDITAMTFVESGELACAVGSARFRASDWKRDMMSLGATGSVWLASPHGEPSRLADGLRYPWGIASDGNGHFVVSESWASQLVTIGRGERPKPVLTNLPGYPAHIVPASGGGYWFALIAPRNQLVELVLRERDMRTQMIETIDPEYWIAPMLRPSDQPLDPMLRGVQRVSGAEAKPWGTSLSCGFVGRITAGFLPDSSFHSRSNGKRHGITSVVEHDGAVLAASHCGFVVRIGVDQQ